MDRRRQPHDPDSRHHDVASDRGAERAAVVCTLIMTARLNEVDPKAWLADVFGRIADLPQQRLDELMPWNWRPPADLARACLAEAS